MHCTIRAWTIHWQETQIYWTELIVRMNSYIHSSYVSSLPRSRINCQYPQCRIDVLMYSSPAQSARAPIYCRLQYPVDCAKCHVVTLLVELFGRKKRKRSFRNIITCIPWQETQIYWTELIVSINSYSCTSLPFYSQESTANLCTVHARACERSCAFINK